MENYVEICKKCEYAASSCCEDTVMCGYGNNGFAVPILNVCPLNKWEPK